MHQAGFKARDAAAVLAELDLRRRTGERRRRGIDLVIVTRLLIVVHRVFLRPADYFRRAGYAQAEFAGSDTGLNMVRCEALVKRARALFPGAADYARPT